MTHPTGPAGPRPGGGAGTGPKTRMLPAVAQLVAVSAVGLVLIVAGLTAPAAEPVRLQWRSATEQERRDYDARRLTEALDELALHHSQTPAVRPEPGPAGIDVPAGPGQDHPLPAGP